MSRGFDSICQKRLLYFFTVLRHLKTPLKSGPQGLAQWCFVVGIPFLKRLIRILKILKPAFQNSWLEYKRIFLNLKLQQGKGASFAFKYLFITQLAYFCRKSASLHPEVIGKFLTVIRNCKGIAF